MQKIFLNKNLFTLVDDSDFEFLNQFKWRAKYNNSAKTYYVESIEKRGVRRIMMHRLIMNPPDNMVIDHRDHNGLNNQRSNLRICTRSQNQQNRRNWGACEYKGVTKCTTITNGKKYTYIKASIKVNDKLLILGNFKTTIDAALAYDNAARKYYGEFANLNFK